jgi:transcriptional regulator with XRE-family HTH domain
MGRYRLGDIIRMTRKSLSITQEQLSEGICSIETLSRVESGKQNPSKEVYELLMERMGRIKDRAYSMLSVSDFKIFEKKQLFERCIQVFDYQRAEYILEEIKSKIGETKLDKQFIVRAEGLVNYRLERISTEEFLQELLEAIRITIPRYDNISLSNWPLTYNEIVLLLNISTAYAEMGDYNNGIRILKEAYNALNSSYMDKEQREFSKVGILVNLSKWYGMEDKYKESSDCIIEGIEICRRNRIGGVLPILLYNNAWNKEKLIEKGVLSPDNKTECIKSLRKAYYIASAMQSLYMMKVINNHMMNYYSINLNV